MTEEAAPSTRARILTAAARLLADGGSEAVSTRAVAAAAGVQAPTLYRLFGDKQGLLDAVTDYGFQRYLAEKQTLAATSDPVQDLRRGWDLHTEFGLLHPAFYALMYGTARQVRVPAAELAYQRLLGLLERIAATGRLRLPPEAAARLIHAANTGVTLALISVPEGERDPELSTRARESVLATITTDQDAAGESDSSLASRALALDAAIAAQPHPLSPAETALLHDWLHRLATFRPSGPA